MKLISKNIRKENLLILAIYAVEFFLLMVAGALFIFFITGCKKEKSAAPLVTVPHVITSSEVNNITSTTASCGGRVTSSGGSKVTERGICWDSISNPALSNNKAMSGADTGVFVCNLTGLNPNLSYHVRAFATNSAGTAYGEELVFTTALFSLPILSTKAADNIIETTASAGGVISSDGSAFIMKRGVCWNTSSNPTTANKKTVDGNNKGEFISNLTDLSASTMYYLRAYATNAAGTAYGNEVSFTTHATALPKLITTMVTNIISGSATCGGNISIGTSVSERGICWSSNHLPTKADHTISSGTGTGNYTANMLMLASKTVYYVRAYATNSIGTAYGNEVSFTSANSGNISYTLVKEANPTTEQLNAYKLIQIAIDSAKYYYNTYTTCSKNVTVYYVPGVPTADGSNNGTIRFGSNTYYMNVGTAMHETAHTLGVGTNGSWVTLVVSGVYLGTNATTMLRSLTGDPAAQLHGDTQHFWPYGINYPTEVTSATDLINHCKIVDAMKKDGL